MIIMLFADIRNDSNLRENLKEFDADLDIPTNDFNLQHFSYNNSGILNLIYGHIHRTNFNGITVSIMKSDKI